MGDRILKFCLTWGLCAACLFAFGIAAAAYFVFTSIVLGVVYNRFLRVDLERRVMSADVSAEEVDRRMLPRDRAVAILRAGIALLVAGLFYTLA